MSGRRVGIAGFALVFAAALIGARPAFAQEATLSGTISIKPRASCRAPP